jgi:polysaccharide biosynthesis/export protein
VKKDGNVWRFPITGNETVLDALGANQKTWKITGQTVWVVRPSPACVGAEQVLPVKWNEIINGGRTDTNYQIMPGDRIYIADDRLVAFDRIIQRFTAPLQTLLGITNQGESMIYTAETLGRNYNHQRQD